MQNGTPKYPAHPLLEEAVSLLRDIVRIPSFSREEAEVADCWESWLSKKAGLSKNIVPSQKNADISENAASFAGLPRFQLLRHHNNLAVWCGNPPEGAKVLLLNSHLDTVRPNASYSRNPFDGAFEENRIYGLGSNDAGASAVCLALTFFELYSEQNGYRNNTKIFPVLAITAEEEVGGEHGIRAMLPKLAEYGIVPGMAIIGEPTGMCPAIAERGLVVLDAVTPGVAGHAARKEGINAIYRAMEDINTLRNFTFPNVSKVLGPVSISVTQISAGKQHNCIPDTCSWTVDVRTTDAHSNADTVELLRQSMKWSTLTPRSTRVWPSVLDYSHPLAVSAARHCGFPFVSPTTSDMSLMHGIPSLKIGPGESARSHSADEFVLVEELNAALHLYPRILNHLAQGV